MVALSNGGGTQLLSSGAAALDEVSPAVNAPPGRRKLFGRAFYESIGSPKMVLAPMVDQSEFVWASLQYTCKHRADTFDRHGAYLHDPTLRQNDLRIF